jgi:3-oxoacyl-[acyl-carrier protein] reductase
MSGKKTAVITGGSGGIGISIGKQLAEENYTVVLGDLRDQVFNIAKEISLQTSADVFGLNVDVTDPNSVNTFFKKIAEQTGHVDVLINNAGITRDATFRKMTYEQWDSVIKVNLYGSFNCTKEVVEDMIREGFGRIVNISSISRFGNRGQANYSASKAGLVGFTMTLAKELAKYGITVNAISPGIIDTDMAKTIPEPIMSDLIRRIPEGRIGRPDEIASLVSFLISEKAQYINGETINVNGGFFF